jgi:hypothetical protein
MPVPSERPLPTVILDRPLIRLYEISLLLGIDDYPTNALLKLCATLDPPVTPITYQYTSKSEKGEYDDLISPRDAHRLMKTIAEKHNKQFRRKPAALDRVSLLLWACGLHTFVMKRPPPYSFTVEQEIKRIRKLKEPQRTIRAIDLLNRYMDAKVIAENWPWNQPKAMEAIERRLNKLCGVPEDDDSD